ncbi:hypothetical protein [Phaffia rhodozyma]|uniref:Uncharacterized protein n=1 Tax=Phaffia rhodozyma TaxID=264483 RepID=A0A0F7SSH7_PHARH|nr:hypothetical protein [Phaffia rhodozyma]
MDSAPNLSTSPGSSPMPCEHGQEVCTACGFDAREENDAFFGFSPVAERGALTLVDFTRSTKDNSIHCKKHGTVDCKQCFNWKKSIAKLQKDASKAQKKKPKNTSNFE